MNHVPIKLGPLALLLTVICLCLSVLAVLTFTTARADMALAERYAQTVHTRYELEAKAQAFLATAPAGSVHNFKQDGMRLLVELGDDGEIIRWSMEKEWTQADTIGGLWNGL